MTGILAIIAVAAFAGWSFFTFDLGQKTGKAAAEAQYVEATKKLEERAKKAEAEAENKIIDMEAAFSAGEAKARSAGRSIRNQGEQHVASYPVFSDPNCVLPDVSLQFLNRARTSMRTTTDSVVPAGAVRGTAATDGRQAVVPLPATTR